MLRYSFPETDVRAWRGIWLCYIVASPQLAKLALGEI